jgi:hypothetical protein
MSRQHKLFDSAEPAPAADTTALTIAAQQLGPEQRLFNQLLEKIEKQTNDLQNLKAMVQAHTAEAGTKLAPLRAQVYAQQEKMVIFLDERIRAPRGLSKRMCDDINDIIAVLLEAVMAAGDPSPALQAVADRFVLVDDDEDLEDGLDKETSSELNRAMAQAMGVEVDANGLLSTDEMIEALMRKMQAEDEAAMNAHEARQAKRKKSPKQKLAEQEQLDAHSALRSIYRKLASALHPDRETDPAERSRKTALMVRVNAANDSKDLLALLRLQMEIDQIDPSSVAAMADDKIRGFNRMLKEQLKTLQYEHQMVIHGLRMSYNVGYGAVTPKVLMGALRAQMQRMQDVLEIFNYDLAAVQDDKKLKKWVKAQIAALEAESAY